MRPNHRFQPQHAGAASFQRLVLACAGYILIRQVFIWLYADILIKNYHNKKLDVGVCLHRNFSWMFQLHAEVACKARVLRANFKSARFYPCALPSPSIFQENPFRAYFRAYNEAPPSGKAVQNSVGVRGFEPPTSRTRTVRSTGLSHTPKACELYHCDLFWQVLLWFQ
jgi:hypothetical protein